MHLPSLVHAPPITQFKITQSFLKGCLVQHKADGFLLSLAACRAGATCTEETLLPAASTAGLHGACQDTAGCFLVSWFAP